MKESDSLERRLQWSPSYSAILKMILLAPVHRIVRAALIGHTTSELVQKLKCRYA